MSTRRSSTTPAPSSPRSRRRAAATGSRRSRRSSTPPGAVHLRGRGALSFHLDLASVGGRAARVRDPARAPRRLARSAPTGACVRPRDALPAPRRGSTARDRRARRGRRARRDQRPARPAAGTRRRSLVLPRRPTSAARSSARARSPARARRTSRCGRRPRRRRVRPQRRLGGGGPACGSIERDSHSAAYAKGWEAIEGYLAVAGAADTVLALEERALVAGLRAEANRLANADHANLVRAEQRGPRAARRRPGARDAGALEAPRADAAGRGRLRLRHPLAVAAGARRQGGAARHEGRDGAAGWRVSSRSRRGRRRDAPKPG